MALAWIRRRRLAKFLVGLVGIVVGMIAVAVVAFLDTAQHVDPENHWVIAQNLALMVAAAVVGIGTVGVVLVRPTVKQIEELAAHAREIEAGSLDGGVETDAGDELGSLYASMNAMRETIRRRIQEAETERERAMAAREESDRLASTLETRTRSFGETMGKTADGDLAARLEVDPDDPESLARVAESFNEAMGELEATVADVDRFTDEVVTAAESTTDRIDAAVASGTEASGAMDEIAADARRQTNRLDETAGELETMSATIEEVAASTDELADSSERAARSSEVGHEDARAAVEEFHRIESRSQSAVETISELEAQMDEIEAIVTTISEIATRTNLLALNASIEAARAGAETGTEAADGFEVVAGEVKSLAEKTQDSAAEVETMIEELRELTDASAGEMRTIQSDVTAGVDTVENVREALSIAARVPAAGRLRWRRPGCSRGSDRDRRS